MDKRNVALEPGERQEFHGVANFPETSTRELSLTRADCRLLLVSSLALFLRRARCGIPITAADLVRLAAYCDPTDGPAEAIALSGVAA